jgi:hypothetical protein
VTGGTATVANEVGADSLDRRAFKREASSVAAGFRSHPLPISDVLLMKGGLLACCTTSSTQPLHLGASPSDVRRGSSNACETAQILLSTYSDEGLDETPRPDRESHLVGSQSNHKPQGPCFREPWSSRYGWPSSHDLGNGRMRESFDVALAAGSCSDAWEEQDVERGGMQTECNDWLIRTLVALTIQNYTSAISSFDGPPTVHGQCWLALKLPST